MIYTQLTKGTNGKKFRMIFYDATRKKIKTIQFGALGYEDFTHHGDIQRKNNYIQRHRSSEKWDEPMTAGSLSYYLLWNKKTLTASYTDYRNRFGFSLY